MKVFLIGAGAQGGACASVLSRDGKVNEVVLADLDGELLKKVKEKINSEKLKTTQVDASDVKQIIEASRGCDLIIDLMPPWMAVNVMKAALEIGAHYVNTAFVEPFWSQQLAGEPLELSSAFKDSNLTALLGCGKAPGLLNIMTRLYTDKLDSVESVKFRVGSRFITEGPYDQLLKPWNPGWSPKTALLDCAASPHVFSEGQYKLVEPYTGIEEWEFPAPIGKMLISQHSHEELYSIPINIGKGISYCDFKYIVAYQPAMMVTLGLASEEEIEFNGVKIKPVDFVTQFIPKTNNMFLEETLESAVKRMREKHFSMIAIIDGKKDGKKVQYVVNCPMYRDTGEELFKLFGTAIVDVALPAVTGGKLIVEGAVKGVIFAEQLDPNRYLELLRQSGVDLIIEEL